MSRGPQPFRQRDVSTAIRAARAAGCEVARIEVDPITGRIIITTVAGTSKEPSTDLDKWLAEHGAHST
jgi:hypothetical protein